MSRPAAAWERPPIAVPLVTSESERTPYLVDYVLLRVTGVLLSVLVLGHFVVTHFVTDVARDDSAFVSRRLSSVLWVVWDSRCWRLRSPTVRQAFASRSPTTQSRAVGDE